jgi:hypothetical protein
MVAEAAPAAHSHVLTIRRAHGTAVKPAAELKASLAKGATAVFALKGVGSLTCKQSSVTAIVGKNPTAPGTATEAITAITMRECTASLPGLKVNKIKALNLPYAASSSDRKGLPFIVTGRKKSKPIELTSTATIGGGTITCTFKSKLVIGSASNKGNTITFSKQRFTRVNASCPVPAANFSAKYGPVHDTSVRGDPKVFVN